MSGYSIECRKSKSRENAMVQQTLTYWIKNASDSDLQRALARCVNEAAQCIRNKHVTQEQVDLWFDHYEFNPEIAPTVTFMYNNLNHAGLTPFLLEKLRARLFRR